MLFCLTFPEHDSLFIASVPILTNSLQGMQTTIIYSKEHGGISSMKSFVMPYFLGRICWFLAHFSLPLCYIPAILCGFIVLHMYIVSFWGKGSLLGLVALEPFSSTMISDIIVDGTHESWTRNAISLNTSGISIFQRR